MSSEIPEGLEREGGGAGAGAGAGGGIGGSDEAQESLSPLEQEVLDEYARLLGNLNTMSSLLLTLSNAPSAAILDGLRGLERKTSLVFTLLKASVYSIVLNQQITDDSGEGNEERERDGQTVGMGMGMGM